MTTKQNATDHQSFGSCQRRRHRQLMIADGTAPEICQLVTGAHVPLYVLGTSRRPLEAITTMLAGERLDTLHIVAHGQLGGFSLGGQCLDAGSLLESAYLLTQWQVRRIALWSCALGRNTQFVEILHRLTGADVLVSSREIGLDAATDKHCWELASPLSKASLHSHEVFDAAALIQAHRAIH
jgi:hypothetical protein